jgi:hypothetical protein
MNIPSLIVHPPAKRGDLRNLVIDGPPDSSIALIDGEFHQQLSVSHRESLNALASGWKVVGAASIGALRSVELRESGMIGVGWVYRYYCRRMLTVEDEVCVIFDPDTYNPLSDALVNIRYALAKLVQSGRVSVQLARDAIGFQRQQHFSRRSFRAVAAWFAERSERGVAEAVLWASAHPALRSIKALDSIELLSQVGAPSEWLGSKASL